MVVRRGGATPSKIYRGTIPVQKVMRGTVEVWSASPYPLSGEWQSTLTTSAQTYATHIIAESGTYTVSQTVTGGGHLVQASLWGLGRYINGDLGPPSNVSTTQVFEAGDLIEFRAGAIVPSGTASGTWSIVKN